MFTLTINTNNAAFTVESNDDDYGAPLVGPELARLLRVIADDVENYAGAENVTSAVHDVNGNTVGRWELVDE